MKTNRWGWIVPALIVAVNAVAVLVRWGSLPEMLPAHFDLQGNAGGSMPRGTLLFYPLISLAVCAVLFVLARRWSKRLQVRGLVILASGIALTVLSSTMVTLTTGTVPLFMLAEPVILGIALVACVICFYRTGKVK